MIDNPTAVVGAFLLERTFRNGQLRIYNIYANPLKKPEAVLWQAQYPTLGVEPEWRVDCALCPPPPSAARQEKQVPVFATRERALSWLYRHRAGKHRHKTP